MFPFARVGRIYLRTLGDVAHHGRNVRITCQLCGHWRISDGKQLHWQFRKNGFPLELTQIGQHLRCTSCGDKAVHIEVTWEKEGTPLARPQLRVVDSCPPGIDRAQWEGADGRERRRLLRLLRG